MACYHVTSANIQHFHSTFIHFSFNVHYSNTYTNKQTINCFIVMAMVGLMLSLPELPPTTTKPFLRHLTAILTASWPAKEILLHQCIFSHACISVVSMPIGFIFAVLIDGDKDNKFSEQDSMNERYLHWKTWPIYGWRVLPSQRCGEISHRIRLTTHAFDTCLMQAGLYRVINAHIEHHADCICLVHRASLGAHWLKGLQPR